jgi:hypothetical protein
MEAILTLYAQSYDEKRPMVCFDEKSYQLLGHTRLPRLVRPGKLRQEDYEYQRAGTRNLFVFSEPKAGQRHVLITQQRTKQDFAYAMRYLVDVLYPDAVCIDVVMDNLNTHHYHSLVEFFGKAEADRIMSRLCFHFTPSHGSWLNMAEIEISVMMEQCLGRRLPSEWDLAQQLLAWEQDSNEAQRKINWTFTIEKAHEVFARHYTPDLSC